MAILPIYTYGHEVLSKVAKPIKQSDAALKTLVEDMFETMHQASGIGLAAPQVGVSLRLIVVDISVIDDYEDESPLVIINPMILETEGERTMEEGCLSLPGIRETVTRPAIITLKYRDENFKEHTEKFDGLNARVIQHEMEHLNGELFIDRLDSRTRREIKQELQAIKRGDIEAEYVLAEK
ncbi:MAG: peptide deformylase [Rhizobacter sp.]|nr:peptide deformylase [Chlorobiales bacterium]